MKFLINFAVTKIKFIHIMNIKNYAVKYFSQSSETVGGYLNDIRKYKVPTPEEEEELFQRYKHGDKSAVNEIVMRNQRFVFSIAKRYAKDESEVCDYVSEGNIGMIEAIRTFDSTKGFKFITYAVWYIRRAMNAFLESRNLVRKTNNQKVGRKPDEVRRQFYAENGYYPTDEEVYEIITEKYNIQINKTDVQGMKMCSISDVVGDDDKMIEDMKAYNTITAVTNSYEERVSKEYAIEKIKKALSYLNDKKKEQDIIKRLYGIGYQRAYTPIEIAEMYNMEPSDVNVLEKQILSYLRENIKQVA